MTHELSLSCWGPAWWKVLHDATFVYPATPTEAHQHNMLTFLEYISRVLPCNKCKRHMINYIEHNPPHVHSARGLQKWVWTYHNQVNRKLGKPLMLFSTLLNKYMDVPCESWTSNITGFLMVLSSLVIICGVVTIVVMRLLSN